MEPARGGPRDLGEAWREPPRPHDYVHDTVWQPTGFESPFAAITSPDEETCIGGSLIREINLGAYEVHPNRVLSTTDSPVPTSTALKAFTKMSAATAAEESGFDDLHLVPRVPEELFERIPREIAEQKREFDRNHFCVAAERALGHANSAQLDSQGFLASRFVAIMPPSHRDSVWAAYCEANEARESAQNRLNELHADPDSFRLRCDYSGVQPWRNAVQGKRPALSNPVAQVLPAPHAPTTPPALPSAPPDCKWKDLPRAVDAPAAGRVSLAPGPQPRPPSSVWAPPYEPVLQQVLLSERDLRAELAAVERDANDGFMVIDTKNSFTLSSAKVHPSDPVTPGPFETGTIVLLHVSFKNERIGLFQAPNEVPADRPQAKPFGLLATFERYERAGKDLIVVMNMDRGQDIGKVIKVTPCKLTRFIPKIPFMPVIRIATQQDLLKRDACRRLEVDILPFCRRILARPDPRMKKIAKTLRVVDVELQLDNKRLIIFVDCSKKTEWNPFSEDVYKSLKKSRSFALKARIWFQRRDCEPF